MLDRRVPARTARARAPRPDSLNLRGWFAAAALAVAAFAAYISLVPFDFRMPADGVSWERVFGSLEARYRARGNLMANSIMFMPLGFFGAGALVPAGARWTRHAASAVVLLAGSIVLSFAIEMMQVFVPGRTPSLADVIAQTLGTAIGLAAWIPLGAEIRYWAGRLASGSNDALRLLLTGYALVRALILLEPFDATVDPGMLSRRWDAGRIVVNPLTSSALSLNLIPSVLSDFVLAVPIGMLAVLGGTAPGRRRSAGPALLLGGAFFVFGELAQVFIRSRTADTLDLLVNLLGMAAGVAAVIAANAGRVENRRPGALPLFAAAGLLACVALYLAYNLSPYDFRLNQAFAEQRLGHLLAVPFLGYYQNPEFKALRDLLLKMSMTLPIGFFLDRLMGFRDERARRLLTMAVLLAAGLFFAAVEAAQALLPSRYPDNTDVLLAVAGVWLGLRLTRPFARKADLRPIRE